MSPITHGLIGWSIASTLENKRDRVLVTVASVIPDIDFISLLFGVEKFREIHHTFTHCLLSVVIYVLFVMLLSKNKIKSGLLAFFAYHSHLLGDLLGSGYSWDIPYLWPFETLTLKFSPPFQWSLNSTENLVITIIFLCLTLYIGVKKKRTPIEIISSKADKALVNVLSDRVDKFKF